MNNQESPPVNPNLFLRAYVASIHRLLNYGPIWRRLPKPGSVAGALIPDRLQVKSSTRDDALDQGSAMTLVASHTTIPVPRLLSSFRQGRIVFTITERWTDVGRDIKLGWEERSPESQARILMQLRAMVEELRKLPPPHGIGPSDILSVGGGGGGGGGDVRVRVHVPKTSFWGPFYTIHPTLPEPERQPGLGEEGVFERLVEVLQPVRFQTWPVGFFTPDGLTPERLVNAHHYRSDACNIRVDGDEVLRVVHWDTRIVLALIALFEQLERPDFHETLAKDRARIRRIVDIVEQEKFRLGFKC